MAVTVMMLAVWHLLVVALMVLCGPSEIEAQTFESDLLLSIASWVGMGVEASTFFSEVRVVDLLHCARLPSAEKEMTLRYAH
jgi:hypothetical protein